MIENELTDKFINVRMNKIEISTEEQPIIGCCSLATCVGILLYSEKHKKAIVAHVADQPYDMFYETIKLILKNKFNDSDIKYKIIPGYYHNHYELKQELELLYKSMTDFFSPFNEENTDENIIKIDDEFTCHEFAFDASKGKFVTNQICINKKCNFDLKRK